MLELPRISSFYFRYPNVVLVFSGIQMKTLRFTPITKWRQWMSSILPFTAAAWSGRPSANKSYFSVSGNIFSNVDCFLSFIKAQKAIGRELKWAHCWRLVALYIVHQSQSRLLLYLNWPLCQIQAHKMSTTPFLTPYQAKRMKRTMFRGHRDMVPAYLKKKWKPRNLFFNFWLKIQKVGLK